MSQKITNKPLAYAVGAALAGTLSAGAVAAAENPFGITPLDGGYMQLASSHEGSCGGKKAEGACGGEKKSEGSCGGEKKSEGSCGGEKKSEGSCGGNAAPATMPEGKCGTGKCGSNK
jgi:uncharacterized low-complexity protein